MPDNWDWFWAGEAGRDNLLRDGVEGAFREASQARSQAARLSSQLAKVQGSMETRLSALASAFDAYVELGDVRERLAGYPDTSALRRQATAAFAVLTRGGVPQRLPAVSVDYWLTDGMNAVIARAAGAPDPDAEARAVAADRDAELFLVAAAGALGDGATVADRVPPLLVSDLALSTAQLALWAAVLAGQYGNVLPGVHHAWRPALDAADAGWRGWARDEARAATPIEILHWIDRQVTASAPGAAAANGSTPSGQADGPVAADGRSDTRTALAAVALALIGRGLGDEVTLLERARELRARIETPEQLTGQQAIRAAAEVASPTVLSQVRTAFLAAPAGSARRAELLTWIQPGLQSAVDVLVSEAEAAPSHTLQASTPGGAVDVDPTGANPEQRAKAEQRVQERFASTPARARVAPAVVAALLLVVLLVAGALGSTTLAVLAGLGAVVALGATVRAFAAERSQRRALATNVEATQTSITQVENRVRALEQTRLGTVAEVRRLASGLRDQLRTPVG